MQANIRSVACVHVYLSPRAVITNTTDCVASVPRTLLSLRYGPEL